MKHRLSLATVLALTLTAGSALAAVNSQSAPPIEPATTVTQADYFYHHHHYHYRYHGHYYDHHDHDRYY